MLQGHTRKAFLFHSMSAKYLSALPARAAKASEQSCRFRFGHSGQAISTWQEEGQEGLWRNQSDVAEIDVLGSLGPTGSRSVHLLPCLTPGGTRALTTEAARAPARPEGVLGGGGGAMVGLQWVLGMAANGPRNCYLPVSSWSSRAPSCQETFVNKCSAEQHGELWASAEGALKTALGHLAPGFWGPTFTFSSSP